MNIDRITKVLRRDKTWTVVSGIAAMVSAFCAAYAIQQASVIWRQQHEGNRPYFAVEEPIIEPVAGGERECNVKIPLKNVGVRPAGKLEIRFIVMKTVDAKKPEGFHDFSCVNDIPSGQAPAPAGIRVTLPSPNVEKRYFIISARYFDAVTGRYYVQSFYMTWAGLKGGKGPSGFSHATQDEAAELVRNLGHLIWRR